MNTSTLLTKAQLLELVRSAVEAAGTQKALAERYGISEQYLTDVLRGRREPGEKLLSALGYERVILYQKYASKDSPGRE